MNLENLTADGPVVCLHFHTDATSKLTRAFINELSAALAAGERAPLVCASDRALLAVFRAFQTYDLRDSRGLLLNYGGGQRFIDTEPGFASGIHLGTEGASVTHGDAIEIPAGGKWLNGRTPDTASRSQLAVFDSTRVGQLVEGLFARWSDRLADATVAPTRAPRPSGVEPQYSGEIDVSVPPGSWDPTDPRRKDSAFIEKVRHWRRKILGGRDHGEIIEGARGQVPRAEFDALK